MVVYLLDQIKAIGVGPEAPANLPNRTFQLTVEGTGAVAASAEIEVSNDRVGWFPVGTISVSGNDMASDKLPATNEAWGWVRATLLTISGTDAKATATMGMM